MWPLFLTESTLKGKSHTNLLKLSEHLIIPCKVDLLQKGVGMQKHKQEVNN